MFICNLTYIKPIEVIDSLLDAHVAWIKANHAAGHIVAWGRKVPREGGMIWMVGPDKAFAEALAAQDPFIVEGAARVEVIEFAPGHIDPEFVKLAMGAM
jgi:uncharacterized protein YciI